MDELPQRLNAAGELLGVPVQVTGSGSILSLHYQTMPIERPDDTAATPADLRTIIHLDLIERGHITARRGFMSLSLALEDADLGGFVSAFEDVLASHGERYGMA